MYKNSLDENRPIKHTILNTEVISSWSKKIIRFIAASQLTKISNTYNLRSGVFVPDLGLHLLSLSNFAQREIDFFMPKADEGCSHGSTM